MQLGRDCLLKYPTHVIGGITFGVLANYYVLQELPLVEQSSKQLLLTASFLSGSVLGSLMPDIDHRQSFIGKRLKPVSYLASLTAGHRGATHSPFIIMLIAALLSLLARYLTNDIQQTFLLVLIAGFTVGALSHVFLDSLTKGGVPLFYPFSSEHYRFANLKTGSMGEKLVSILMIGFLIGITIYESKGIFFPSLILNGS